MQIGGFMLQNEYWIWVDPLEKSDDEEHFGGSHLTIKIKHAPRQRICGNETSSWNSLGLFKKNTYQNMKYFMVECNHPNFNTYAHTQEQ